MNTEDTPTPNPDRRIGEEVAIIGLIRAARKVNAAFNEAERFEAIGEDRLDAIWELGQALMTLREVTFPNRPTGATT